MEEKQQHDGDGGVSGLTRFLKVSEAAEWLGVGRSKMYKLLDDGAVPSVYMGRSRRIPMRHLAEYQQGLMAKDDG